MSLITRMWYRKNSPTVLVEAVRLTEANAGAVAAWCGGELIDEIDPEHPEETQPGINVPTALGTQRASLSMYVIKAGGVFATAHVRIFEEYYVPVKGDKPPPESIGDTRKRMGYGDGPASVKMI